MFVPSPLKNCSCLCSSVLSVTLPPTPPQRQSTSWHRSVLQKVGSYWGTLSSLCSPHSPIKIGNISDTDNAVTLFQQTIFSHRSMCKCSNHHCSWSLRHQRSGANRLSCREGGGNSRTTRWEVVRNWVFNHPQKLLWTISCPDAQLVQQLDWEKNTNDITDG